ncbi:MAG: glycosyltransferase family 2 protein [Bacilli bacterium]
MKISVIVPVYNVEKYIDKCLNSLVHQTIDNYEIIVINDGTKDNSVEIINKYIRNYPKLIRFFDKKNEGLSKTRNLGIKYAKGEYISFIDSDDWIELNMLEKMYNKAKTNDFDVVVCNVNYIYPNRKKTVLSNIKKDILTVKNLKKSMVNIFPTACNKIYKKTIFDKILFKNNVLYEDVEFTYRLYLVISTIGVVNEALYNYLQRENAITSTFNDNIFDYISNFNGVVEYYKKANKFNLYHKELEYAYVRYIYAVMVKGMTNFNDTNKFKKGIKVAIKNVKEQFPKYRFNSYFYTSLKGIYLLTFSKFTANLFYKIKRLKNKSIKSNQFFLVFIILTLFIPLFYIFTNNKEVSILENKKLASFPTFSLSSIKNGFFQKNVDEFANDNFIFAEEIKKIYNDSKNYINNQFKEKFLSKDMCVNNYVSLGNDLYNYNCDNYMMYKGENIKDVKASIVDKLNNYNNIIAKNADVKFYNYFIESDYSNDFSNSKNNSKIFNFINNNLNATSSRLLISDYEQYKDYWYKTDHHWNYKGSYQGYVDIIHMMSEDEILKPLNKRCFDNLIFQGSRARLVGDFSVKENFCAYDIKTKPFTTMIDGSIKNYGNEDKYFNNEIKENNSIEGINHYGIFYGADYLELIYDFDNPKKENLLIISSSFSNAINRLLASHYNKTYKIDLRYTNSFNLTNYVKKNNIKNVLFIGDTIFYAAPEFKIGG